MICKCSQLAKIMQMFFEHVQHDFELNPAKTNDKIFQKNQKALILAHFGSNLPIFGQKWIFIKNPFHQFSSILVKYYCAKFQIKLMNGFWDTAVTDGWTDGQTDRQDWIYSALGGPNIDNWYWQHNRFFIAKLNIYYGN